MITRWLLACALCLDWRGVHAVEPPYLTLRDNLDEPTGLGMCIDLKGWRPVQFTDAQLHSCKPSDGPAGGGSDQQFVPRGSAVMGLADAAGHCLQATSATAGAHIDAPLCEAGVPLQQIDWNAGTGKLQLRGTSLCLTASPQSRPAGVGTASGGTFVARNFRLESCTTTDQTLVEWRIVTVTSSEVPTPGGGSGGTDTGQTAAAPTTTTTESPHHCHDGQDNDGDGVADCDDPDCATSRLCANAASQGTANTAGDRNTETGRECSDGRDNDRDGVVDCADPDCSPVCGDPTCFVAGSEFTSARCCDTTTGAEGDASCWGGAYDFSRCCPPTAPAGGRGAGRGGGGGTIEDQDCTLPGFGRVTTESCPAPTGKGRDGRDRQVPSTCPANCAAAFMAWNACADSTAVIAEADAALGGQLTPFVALCAAAAGSGH